MSKFASSTGNIPVTGLESYSLEDRCHTDVHIPQEYLQEILDQLKIGQTNPLVPKNCLDCLASAAIPPWI